MAIKNRYSYNNYLLTSQTNNWQQLEKAHDYIGLGLLVKLNLIIMRAVHAVISRRT